MSAEESSFHNLTASEDLQFVKHNPTDYSQFQKFQKEMDERFSKLEKNKTQKEVKANLRKWEAILPERWRDAALPKIKTQGSIDAGVLIQNFKCTSAYIKGPSGSGKTYLAYAMLRRYIGMGWVTPSQIKIVSEELLMGLAATGWEGQSRFSELFKPKYTIYLFDGVGRKDSYTPREGQLYEQLIDHIYGKSLTAIFTSNSSASQFSSHLSDSGQSKLSHLVANRVISLKSGELPKPSLDDLTEDEEKQVAADLKVEGTLWDE